MYVPVAELEAWEIIDKTASETIHKEKELSLGW